MSDTNELTLPGGVSVEAAGDEFSRYFESLLNQGTSELGFVPKAGATSEKTLADIPFGGLQGQWQPAATCTVTTTYLGEPTAEQRKDTPVLFTVSQVAGETCAQDLAGCFGGGASTFCTKAQAKGQLFEIKYRVEIKEEDPVAGDPTNPSDPMDPFGI